MTSRWRVEWAEVAARDLDRIVEYVAEDSELEAARVLDRLEAAALRLSSSPQRDRIVPELRRFEITAFRELVVRPWRIVYRVASGRVLVVGVFDSRRDLELTLLGRLTYTE